MSETGKARRLARMFNARSGRRLCLAFDHGMQVGPVPGTEDPARVLDAAAEAAVDAVILNPGMMARHGHRLAGGPAVVLRIDQTDMTGTRFQLHTGRITPPAGPTVQRRADRRQRPTHRLTREHSLEKQHLVRPVIHPLARTTHRF